MAETPASLETPAGAESLLGAELTAVRGELARVDAKCATLTTLTMAGLAFIATKVGHGPELARALLSVAGLMLAAATLTLLTVISPHIGYIRLYARLSPTGVRELLADQAAAAKHHENSLISLSRVVSRKYLGLLIAVTETGTAVALIAVATLLTGVLF
ncbi:hypothetical protein GCM10023195_13310 [Actinoallomurus liliacearum]|uniref:Pycsar effector protein domain-containing protein n=1 Tax=Actinoallomurus liliacearum TaxID=1080073 RepID=A0ABP8TFZ0_9ACTN